MFKRTGIIFMAMLLMVAAVVGMLPERADARVVFIQVADASCLSGVGLWTIVTNDQTGEITYVSYTCQQFA